MKLSDWARKQGIAYLTAYRWFRDGKLPVKAYQSDSGTIIVQDDSETSEQPMGNVQSNDVMTTILKKTVEFSKNNATIEDFAAWILSNFSLKFSNSSENPKYSKIKPKSEEVQKHFQQFLKPKGEKPKPQMFVAPPESLEEISEQSDPLSEFVPLTTEDMTNTVAIPELTETFGDLLMTPKVAPVKIYGNVVEGVVTRSVDLTPQLNYTGSTNPAFDNCSVSGNIDLSANPLTNNTNSLTATGIISNANYFIGHNSASLGSNNALFNNAFKPTQKELESANKVLEVIEKPKRGRKPFKNSRKS